MAPTSQDPGDGPWDVETGSGSNPDGPWIPPFVYELRPLSKFVGTLSRLGRNPREFVIAFVLDWALDGTLDLVAGLLNIILEVGNILGRIPWLLYSSVTGLITPVVNMLTELLASIGDLGAGLAAAAGPGGPIVWALYAVGAWLLVTEVVPSIGSALPTVGPAIEVASQAAGVLNPFNYLGGGD